MPAKKYVTTGVAAAEIGVAQFTLQRWWKGGIVTPALVTPGGHARWDLDELKEQLRLRRQAGPLPEQAD